jgi:hypothetical protein
MDFFADIEYPREYPMPHNSPSLHLKGSLHPLHYSHPSPCSSPQLSHFFHQGNIPPGRQESISVNELVEQLNNTEVLHEQADIIHYLYLHR